MSDPLLKSIPIRRLGLVHYQEGLRLQEQAHALCVAGESPGFVLALEHHPVLTLGKNSSSTHFLQDANYYKNRGIEIVPTERGGQVTAHEPGQLVLYPILPLSQWGISARRYVNTLEQAVIQVLQDYGVVARRDAEHPGVWVGASKICALGIRIKQRVSMHGLALNVNNNMGIFTSIVPCGIQGRGVTSLKQQLGKTVPLSDVMTKLIIHFMTLLERPWHWEGADG